MVRAADGSEPEPSQAERPPTPRHIRDSGNLAAGLAIGGVVHATLGFQAPKPTVGMIAALANVHQATTNLGNATLGFQIPKPTVGMIAALAADIVSQWPAVVRTPPTGIRADVGLPHSDRFSDLLAGPITLD